MLKRINQFDDKVSELLQQGLKEEALNQLYDKLIKETKVFTPLGKQLHKKIMIIKDIKAKFLETSCELDYLRDESLKITDIIPEGIMEKIKEKIKVAEELHEQAECLLAEKSFQLVHIT